MRTRVIAFYLPQYHPFKEMMSGGEKDSPNGRMWVRQNRFLKDITNHGCPQIWDTMTSDARGYGKRKQKWRVKQASKASCTGIIGSVTEKP